MLTFSDAQLNAWIAGFIWPLARVLAVIATSPVLGNEAVPARVKLGLGVLIALAVAPLAPPPAGVALYSGDGLLVLAQQVGIGIAMGFAMRIVFTMADLAGELAGLQMGLGFASFFDPQSSNTSTVIAQYLGLLVGLTFLALDGHLMIIATLAESFHELPISAHLPSASMSMTLVKWGGAIFSTGVALALPILAAMLIANIALGILTRAAPQLNVFSVGFPITLLLGFMVLILVIPQFASSLEKPIQLGLDMMLTLAREAR